jgi:hypothetical protein
MLLCSRGAKFDGKAMCGVVVSTVLARGGVERHTGGCTGWSRWTAGSDAELVIERLFGQYYCAA